MILKTGHLPSFLFYFIQHADTIKVCCIGWSFVKHKAVYGHWQLTLSRYSLNLFTRLLKYKVYFRLHNNCLYVGIRKWNEVFQFSTLLFFSCTFSSFIIDLICKYIIDALNVRKTVQHSIMELKTNLLIVFKTLAYALGVGYNLGTLNIH